MKQGCSKSIISVDTTVDAAVLSDDKLFFCNGVGVFGDMLDSREVSPEMSVQYNGFLYCVLPAIAKDAALKEVTGPQTLIPGWEPVRRDVGLTQVE